MKEQAKNILKIVGIWIGLILILCILLCCFVPDMSYIASGYLFWYLICIPFISLLAFIPAIAVLYFLFKKVQNKNYRILLTAFIIPFTNLIYLFIEHFFDGTDMISNVIGFLTLFITIPSFMLIVLFTPKSIFSIKWDVLKTALLMIIFGVGLISLSEITLYKIDNVVAQNKLKKYEPIIEKLEDYKARNGAYPQKLEDDVQEFEHFFYKNEGEHYILTVGDSYMLEYNYCSNPKMEGCFPQRTNYANYTQYGKWIMVEEDD